MHCCSSSFQRNSFFFTCGSGQCSLDKVHWPCIKAMQVLIALQCTLSKNVRMELHSYETAASMRLLGFKIRKGLKLLAVLQ